MERQRVTITEPWKKKGIQTVISKNFFIRINIAYRIVLSSSDQKKNSLKRQLKYR